MIHAKIINIALFLKNDEISIKETIHMHSSASDISNVFNYLYRKGYTTSSGGNISLRLDSGTFRISPSGSDKGSLKPEDIIETDSSGNFDSTHKPSMEFPFHLAVYKTRPDISALIHVHSPAMVAFSLLGESPGINCFPLIANLIGEAGFVPYECPGSENLAIAVAKEMGKGFNIVILQNHGVLVGASTIWEAVSIFEIVEHLSRILLLSRNKLPAPPAKIELPAVVSPVFKSTENTLSPELNEKASSVLGYFRRLTNQRISPAGLISISSRIDNKSFLFIADQHGNYYSGGTLCKVLNTGEKPGLLSIQENIHSFIYKHNPEINAIICASPEYCTIKGLCNDAVETSLIPESYLILNKIKTIEVIDLSCFEDVLIQKDFLNPGLILVRGDRVISCGKDLYQAFDRIEVMEFTARSEIWAGNAGIVHGLSAGQLALLDSVFRKEA